MHNGSFDTLTTDAVKKDYSFTLLEATYLERTGLRFEPSDYISFGLADKNGFLTNAGKLMTDQHTVYNSRMFCTRWNGLEKGSIFDDALDDKEYEGNLIYLLKSGSEFIRNNSKVRFVKEAQYRVDKPDYAERAVTEALVNALIHRMKYMERRGSGLRKIINESEKLPGYTEACRPEFFSTATDFRVVLKNVNYLPEHSIIDETQVKTKVKTQVKTQVTISNEILAFCSIPHSKAEIAEHCGYKNTKNFTKKYIRPLLDSKALNMTVPDKPNSRNQKYIAVHTK